MFVLFSKYSRPPKSRFREKSVQPHWICQSSAPAQIWPFYTSAPWARTRRFWCLVAGDRERRVYYIHSVLFPNFSHSPVQFSHSVLSSSLQSHGLQHARLPCPSPSPRACSNSRPLSRCCHPTISSRVIPFFSCLQSFPASGSLLKSAVHIRWSNYWSFGFSSILLIKYSGLISFRIDWFDLLAVKGLPRVFSNTTVQKHQFFSV